ncbi:uncharacterized protein LOC131249200 [Magnolia sinica]|uniref:uncharacterized protein LOC131249200 n=1 Tax=Magnolia sinica TaxID=86752 RepID=UPI002657DB22|nr:uncharacterized protein LOC131249200 [Magnolia sinica]
MGKEDKKDTDRSYHDFEPLTDWVREEGHDTIFVSVPGFKKEQLTIELNEFRKMKISGERPIQGNNWIRFSYEFTVPDYCNLSKISSVEFKNGIVSLIIPKMTTQTGVQDQLPQKKESMLDQKGGHPIDIQDQSMLKSGPCIPIDIEDQPMLKTGYAIDRQNQPVPFKECCKYCEGSFPTGLNWIRGLNVNMVVTTMVGLALGIYAVYYVKWQ